MFLLQEKVLRPVTVSTLIAFSIYSMEGCYTVSRSDFLGNETVAGSQTVESWSFKFLQTSAPTQLDPILRLRFDKSPHIRFQTVKKYRTVKTPDYVGTGALALVGGGIIYGATRLDSSTSSAKTVKNVLLLAGVLIALFSISFMVQNKGQSTSSTLEDGELRYANGEGESTLLKAVMLQVEVNNVRKSYYTNLDGSIAIDLVNDFGLRTFTNPEDVRVRVRSENYSIQKEFQLTSSEWTAPHIQTDWDGGIFQEPSARSKRLTDYQNGEVFRILDFTNPDWVKIKFSGGEGWIPAQAGRTIWTVISN